MAEELCEEEECDGRSPWGGFGFLLGSPEEDDLSGALLCGLPPLPSPSGAPFLWVLLELSCDLFLLLLLLSDAALASRPLSCFFLRSIKSRSFISRSLCSRSSFIVRGVSSFFGTAFSSTGSCCFFAASFRSSAKFMGGGAALDAPPPTPGFLGMGLEEWDLELEDISCLTGGLCGSGSGSDSESVPAYS